MFDAENVLFGDKKKLIAEAIEAVRAGATVGIHTHFPEDPLLADLMNEPDVVWGKTHLDLYEDPPSAAEGAIKLVA